MSRPVSRYAVLLLLFVAGYAAEGQEPNTVRIKDIATISGVRENQLMGIGLVTGLAGRGDSVNSLITRTSIANLMSAFGVEVSSDDIRSKNSAVVTLTADLPPFTSLGDRVTVHVASLGDAGSLRGGMLLQTNLKAANGRVYAVAQGVVSTASHDESNKTIGIIPGGAIVERDVPSDFKDQAMVALILNDADFTTAAAIATAISEIFNENPVRAINAAIVEVELTDEQVADPVSFLSKVEQINVEPDVPAKVVINERSGVVVLGDNVRIGPVAISYRDSSMRIQPISSYRRVNETKTSFVVEQTATVSDFIELLQELDVDTDTIIEVLKLVSKAGALFGRLIIE